MSAPREEPSGLPVAIFTALPEEMRPLLVRAEGLRRAGRSGAAAGRRVRVGRLAGARVLLACTGDGAANAREGIREVLGAFPASRWIGAGFAGALSKDLEPGTVVVARALRDGDGMPSRPLDAKFAGRAMAAGGAVSATFVRAAALAATAAEKADLRRATCYGGDEPAATDLESWEWAAAAPAGLPGVLIRVISDAAAEDLPEFLARCVRPGGGIDRAEVVRQALRSASGVGKLLSMRRRARFSAERLADFLERFAGLGF